MKNIFSAPPNETTYYGESLGIYKISTELCLAISSLAPESGNVHGGWRGLLLLLNSKTFLLYYSKSRKKKSKP